MTDQPAVQPDDIDLAEADIDQMMADGNPPPCSRAEGLCVLHGYHRHAPATDPLREQYAAAMREHYLTDQRDEADADGNMPCRCGDWREPGPMGSDEDDWDSHLADAVLAVRDTELQQLREQVAEARTALAMQQGISADLRVESQARGEKLARFHEGEEPHLDEAAVATPAEWIWLWNRAAPAKRLEVAEQIQDAQGRAHRCLMGNHEGELEQLRADLTHEQEQREDLRRRLKDTSDACNEATTAIHEARKLHIRNVNTGTCEHCSERDYPDYAVPWPCPTIAALGQPQPPTV